MQSLQQLLEKFHNIHHDITIDELQILEEQFQNISITPDFTLEDKEHILIAIGGYIEHASIHEIIDQFYADEAKNKKQKIAKKTKPRKTKKKRTLRSPKPLATSMKRSF